jgi:hypothetical protein
MRDAFRESGRLLSQGDTGIVEHSIDANRQYRRLRRSLRLEKNGAFAIEEWLGDRRSTDVGTARRIVAWRLHIPTKTLEEMPQRDEPDGSKPIWDRANSVLIDLAGLPASRDVTIGQARLLDALTASGYGDIGVFYAVQSLQTLPTPQWLVAGPDVDAFELCEALDRNGRPVFTELVQNGVGPVTIRVE